LSARAQTKPDADCYRQDCFRRFHSFALRPDEKTVQRFAISLLSLGDRSPLVDASSKRVKAIGIFLAKISACQTLQLCND
jgi:hypothetical protein